MKYILIVYFLCNICAKNYRNGTMWVQDYSKSQVGRFLRHSVWALRFIKRVSATLAIHFWPEIQQPVKGGSVKIVIFAFMVHALILFLVHVFGIITLKCSNPVVFGYIRIRFQFWCSQLREKMTRYVLSRTVNTAHSSPVYTIQPVIKPVVEPVVSCKRGITNLSTLQSVWKTRGFCACHARKNISAPVCRATAIHHACEVYRLSRTTVGNPALVLHSSILVHFKQSLNLVPKLLG